MKYSINHLQISIHGKRTVSMNESLVQTLAFTFSYGTGLSPSSIFLWTRNDFLCTNGTSKNIPWFSEIFVLAVFEGRGGKPASFNIRQLEPHKVEALSFLKNMELKRMLVLSSPQPETVAPISITVPFHRDTPERTFFLCSTDLVSGPLHLGTAKAFGIFKKPSDEVAREELAISC